MAKLPVGSTVAFQSLYATGMLDPTGTRSSAIQLHHIHLTLNGIGYSDFALSTLIQTCYGHHVLSDSTSDFVLRLIRMAKSGVYEAYWQPRSLRTLLLRAEVARPNEHDFVDHGCVPASLTQEPAANRRPLRASGEAGFQRLEPLSAGYRIPARGKEEKSEEDRSMYLVRRVHLNKTDQLDTLAHACGELYSRTLVLFWRTVRHTGIWLRPKHLMRLFPNDEGSHLHAHSADACVQAFFSALSSWRERRVRDPKAHPPRRRKWYFRVE